MLLLLQATGPVATNALQSHGVDWGAYLQITAAYMREWFTFGGQLPLRFFTLIDYHQYFVVSAFIFCLGFYGVVARRNAISMLLAMELMLNAVNVNMSSFNVYWGPHLTRAAFTSEEQVYTNLGQCFSVFAIIVAAAEAAVGLAIIIAFYRARKSINLSDARLLRW